VIHSLDHTQIRRILDDPLWIIESDNPEYQLMATIIGILDSAFTEDLPFVPFESRFKDLKHDFFQNIYKRAYEIDPYMADNMEACIDK
jgi:hypothetical protein